MQRIREVSSSIPIWTELHARPAKPSSGTGSRSRGTSSRHPVLRGSDRRCFLLPTTQKNKGFACVDPAPYSLSARPTPRPTTTLARLGKTASSSDTLSCPPLSRRASAATHRVPSCHRQPHYPPPLAPLAPHASAAVRTHRPSCLHQALHQSQLPSTDPAPEDDKRGVPHDLHALELVVLLDHPLME